MLPKSASTSQTVSFGALILIVVLNLVMGSISSVWLQSVKFELLSFLTGLYKSAHNDRVVLAEAAGGLSVKVHQRNVLCPRDSLVFKHGRRKRSARLLGDS